MTEEPLKNASAELRPSLVTPWSAWIRLVLGNAFALSFIYLVAGFLVELLRHVYPTRVVSHVLVMLEQTPGRMLQLAGLLDPIRMAYSQGELSTFGARWIFGGTMVAIILLAAMFMALVMALAQRAWVLLLRR